MTDPAGGKNSPCGWPRSGSRIAAACEAAGRDASELTLIAVTKTRPASDVRLLSELGVRRRRGEP